MGRYCGAFNQRLLKVNIQGKVILLELSFRKSNVMAAALEGLELKTPETEDGARMRFQVELEFVQCLANPHYLNFLAQRGYFKEQSFINYLKYLLYWKKPEYAKFLKYPQCLHFLELLQYEHFRRELVNPACAKFIDEQQILHWQYYSRRRMRMNLPKTGQTGPGTEPEQSGR